MAHNDGPMLIAKRKNNKAGMQLVVAVVYLAASVVAGRSTVLSAGTQHSVVRKYE